MPKVAASATAASAAVSAIPGARFVSLDSRNHVLLDGEPAWSKCWQEVRAFLGTGRAAAADPPASAEQPPPAAEHRAGDHGLGGLPAEEHAPGPDDDHIMLVANGWGDHLTSMGARNGRIVIVPSTARPTPNTRTAHQMAMRNHGSLTDS